jgi:thiamine kinase-like enzyme
MIQLAKFHASNWGIKPENAKYWDIAGYWTGHKREANKKDIGKAWPKALVNVGKELGVKGATASLGKKLAETLDWMNDEFEKMSPITQVHGDYKISNVFIQHLDSCKASSYKHSKSPSSSSSAPKTPPGDKKLHLKKETVWLAEDAEIEIDSYHYSTNMDCHVYAIDWQWFGLGNCAIDVAYFIATSVHTDNLEDQKLLLKVYYTTLVQNGIEYSYKLFKRHFKICWINFFTYTVVSKWAEMDMEKINRYQEKRKDGLHIRSIPHMKKLLYDAEKFLDQLIAEKKEEEQVEANPNSHGGNTRKVKTK